MQVDSPYGSRFDLALSLLKAGSSDLVFNGVSFAKEIASRVLEVRAFSTSHGNVTSLGATTDLMRAMETLSTLREENVEFKTFTDALTPRFSVILDDGMGSSEICSLKNGKIQWISRR